MLFRRLSLVCLTRCVVLLGGCLAGLGNASPALAQADSLQSIARRFAHYSQQTPAEKLFLHLDRPSYVSGESMWFKVYAVEGSSHRPLPVSSVAYVEVLDPVQKPVLQAKVSLKQATGAGSFVLPATLPSGRYTVRAYTSWMRNFSPELYFHTSVAIVNTRAPLGVAAKPAAAAYDLQLFPEGGYLVQGVPSKVGFKLTNGAGQGVAAEGTVLDQSGNTVASFRTLRFGLGSFSFTPAQAGQAYRVVAKLANQQTVTASLPPAREEGYVMRLVDGGAGVSQLRLVVQTRGAALENERVYLLGHAGQKVALATAGELFEGRTVFTVDKQQLAAGISHFTLFNSRRQPVCERLYFRPPTNALKLTAQADKRQYTAREKVTLQVAADQAASLSVAVYQVDSLSAAGGPDMAGYLWLTSDLKGAVENPGYYLSPEAAEAADNLMLTQGWSRFQWKDVLSNNPGQLPYLPELNGPLVRGRVMHRFTGASASNIPAYLSSPSRHIQLYTAVSKPEGSLQFEVPDLYGRRQLIAQTNTQRDSMYRIELFDAFAPRPAGLPASPLAVAESWAVGLRRRAVQAEVQQRYYGSRPVVYTAPATDSIAFYGQPSEKYRLDDYTRFKVMEEVMREYVPGVLVRIRKDGFHFLVPDNNSNTVSENPLVLLDGMPVFNVNRIMAFDPLKVQKLDVVKSRYLLGPLISDGIVSYTTYKGDLAGFPLDAHALLQEYEGLQGQREFYAPRYDAPRQQQSHLPDFRNLLYWNPNAPAGAPLTFYTSDQVGTYRVVVQGLAGTGQAGSASFTFDVKAPL
ncbi:hypothetical protein LRS06_06520 [Hymenobacter sp. J193]|uniref:hypothetical protein n=1 Tax=Hymenobacter sp. J193 TaxID=2898429 RepID=UPI0021515A2D|nr:hypothetical protein [Hymenobacter sp. J193]MCR5887440.1 hypothetical protein [Hymenobacter sp. J193]